MKKKILKILGIILIAAVEEYIRRQFPRPSSPSPSSSLPLPALFSLPPLAGLSIWRGSPASPLPPGPDSSEPSLPPGPPLPPGSDSSEPPSPPGPPLPPGSDSSEPPSPPGPPRGSGVRWVVGLLGIAVVAVIGYFTWRRFLTEHSDERSERDIKPEIIEMRELRHFVRERYRAFSHLPHAFFDETPQPIAESFINLALIREKERDIAALERRYDRLGAEFRDERLATFERINAMKESIALKDLFSPIGRDKAEHQKLLILGEAGIGKSVLCQYLATQWAEEKTPLGNELRRRFNAVFWLKLRDVAQWLGERKASVAEALDAFCLYGDDRPTPEALQGCLEGHKQHVLFILDGYDEIMEKIKPHQGLDLLLRDIADYPYVLMTSRPQPQRINKLGSHPLHFDRRLENMGLTDPNVKAFVEHFVPETKEEASSSSNLLRFLKENPSIWGIAHIPLHLSLLCWLWKNKRLQAPASGMTLTGLYSEIVARCRELDQDRERTSALSPATDDFLEVLAFEGMKTQRLLLSPDALNAAFSSTQTRYPDVTLDALLRVATCKVGFLRSTGLGGKRQRDQTHYFVHLTFQEFWAARWIHRGFLAPETPHGQAMRRRLLAEKYTPRYRLVWWYTAGLLYASGQNNKDYKGLEAFWSGVHTPPVEWIGDTHYALVRECLNECRADADLEWHRTLLAQQARLFKGYAAYWRKRHNLAVSLQRTRYVVGTPVMREALRVALGDEDSDVRSAVVSALSGCLGDREVLSKVLGLLGDKSPSVRSAVVRALSGRLGDREVLSTMLGLLGDSDEDVRSAVVSALSGCLGDREVLSKVLGLLGDSDWRLRESAVKLLSGCLGDREVLSKVLGLVGDEHWKVRSAVVSALLGRLGDREVLSKVLGLLGDSDWRLRESAVKLLSGRLGDREVLSKVLGLLGDWSSGVRSAVVSALSGRLGDREVLSKVLGLLGDSHPYVRSAVVSALSGRLGDREVLSKVLGLLGDEDYYVRSAVVSALSVRLGDREVLSKVLGLLGDSHPYVRSAVVSALSGRLGDREVLSKVLGLLGDENFYVRFAVVSALSGRLGDREVLSKVLGLLGDRSPSVRSAVVSALSGRLGDREVLSKVLGLLGDRSPSVRSAVVSALSGRLGDREVLSKVLGLLGDSHPYVRYAVVRVLLGSLGDPKVLDLLHDVEFWTRKAVVGGLLEGGGLHSVVRGSALRVFNAILEQKESILIVRASGQAKVLQVRQGHSFRRIQLTPKRAQWLEEQFKELARSEEYPTPLLDDWTRYGIGTKKEGTTDEADSKRLELKAGDIDSPDAKAPTRLFIAVAEGSLAPLRALVRQQVAALPPSSERSLRLMSGLLPHWPEIVTPCTHGSSSHQALINAVSTGTLEDFKRCATAVGTGALVVRDAWRNTLLHRSALFNRLDLVQYLLEQSGVSRDVPNVYGLTALHVAAYYGRLALFNVLRGEGEDQQSLDELNPVPVMLHPGSGVVVQCTPLHFALLGRRYDIAEMLLETDSHIVHVALQTEEPELLSWVVRRVSKKALNARHKEDGLTPLGRAAQKGDLGSVMTLLSCDQVRLKTPCKGRQTPLHLAARHGHADVVRTLLRCAATRGITGYKDEPDAQDNSALRLARTARDALPSGAPQRAALKVTYNVLKKPPQVFDRPAVFRDGIKNLVLQGGGPKGLAYLGALEQLFQMEHLRGLQRVGGTSAGAITAVAVALNYPMEKMKTLILSKSLEDFIPGVDAERLRGGKWSKLWEAVKAGYRENVGWSSFWNVFRPLHNLKKGLEGFCDGKEFHTWLEEKVIREKLEEDSARADEKKGQQPIPAGWREWITFGEWGQLVTKSEYQYLGYKHLHVVTTLVSGKTIRSITLGSEDPGYQNVPVSDGVRASMSIPVLFKPFQLRVKTPVLGRDQFEFKIMSPSDHYCLDGGTLRNYPLGMFDRVKYVNPASKADRNERQLAPTLGLSLYTPAHDLDMIEFKDERGIKVWAKENESMLKAGCKFLLAWIRSKKEWFYQGRGLQGYVSKTGDLFKRLRGALAEKNFNDFALINANRHRLLEVMTDRKALLEVMAGKRSYEYKAGQQPSMLKAMARIVGDQEELRQTALGDLDWQRRTLSISNKGVSLLDFDLSDVAKGKERLMGAGRAGVAHFFKADYERLASTETADEKSETPGFGV